MCEILHGFKSSDSSLIPLLCVKFYVENLLCPQHEKQSGDLVAGGYHVKINNILSMSINSYVFLLGRLKKRLKLQD